MAKKKNTVKSAPKSLRQALSAVKTAIIHFSEDHIVAIGYNPASKETIVSDIPQNLSSQFVLGEGGGGSPQNPIMTINVVNNTGGGFIIPSIDYIDNKLTFVIHPVVESTATLSIPWPWFDNVEGYTYDVYKLTDFNSETCTVTNLVNCFFPFAEDDDYGTVQITDPTLPASFTFTALSLN